MFLITLNEWSIIIFKKSILKGISSLADNINRKFMKNVMNIILQLNRMLYIKNVVSYLCMLDESDHSFICWSRWRSVTQSVTPSLPFELFMNKKKIPKNVFRSNFPKSAGVRLFQQRRFNKISKSNYSLFLDSFEKCWKYCKFYYLLFFAILFGFKDDNLSNCIFFQVSSYKSNL